MRIINLHVENVKRIVAVDITPTGDLILVTGKNGEGKSSVLDSIWWAIAGTKHLQTKPIRAGQNEAVIRLDMGEVVVRRRFTAREDGTFGTSVTVQTVDGMRYAEPQKLLNSLIGALSFDPLRFSDMPAKEQIGILRSLLPAIDFAGVDAANLADFTKRTELSREAKRLETAAAAIVVSEQTPKDPIDESALLDELGRAAEVNQGIVDAAAKVDRMRKERDYDCKLRDQYRSQAEQLRQQAAEYDAHADKLGAKMSATEAEIEAAPAPAKPVDTLALRAKVDEARCVNRLIEQARTKSDLASRALETDVAVGKLTKAIADRNAWTAAAIQAAKLPIPGLSFNGDEVLLDGIPFAQASSAQKLRIGLAVGAALSPKLKVICIKDGSLLDANGLQLVEQFAEEHGLQVWLERVDDSGRVGVVIEDGGVKGAAPVLEAAE